MKYIKNTGLFICLYLVCFYIIFAIMRDPDAFDNSDAAVTALFFALPFTVVITYLWNKLMNKPHLK